MVIWQVNDAIASRSPGSMLSAQIADDAKGRRPCDIRKIIVEESKFTERKPIVAVFDECVEGW